ncbi:homeobox-domain-containing protein [Peniophora sp. CONT]|nr:homeobox-domain-containing protein [Peniophora sp. CONT]
MAQGMNPYPTLHTGDTHSQMPLPASAAYQGYSTQPRTTHTDPSYIAQYDAYGNHQVPPTNEPAYGSYTSQMGSSYTTQAHATQRASPGLPATSDPRRLPPLSVPPTSNRYHDAPYYAAHPQPDPALISPADDVRSPQGSYPQSYAGYSSLQGAMYGQPMLSSSRTQAGYPGVSPHAQFASATSHVGVERTSSRHVAGQYPYARIPSATTPTDYGPQSSEPSVKKKRKRADARQLEVLTAVFARTQFPSTEERIQLGEQLGMTPRTVQIWFQNRRQALRQGQPSGTRGKSASAAAVSSAGHTSSAQNTARAAATGSASVSSSSRAANVAATSAGSSSLASRQARSVTPAAYTSRSPAATASTSGPSYGSNSRSPEHPHAAYSTSRSPPPGTSSGRSGAHSTVRGSRGY